MPSFNTHCFADAVVVMVSSTQSVQENAGPVMVCVDSGIGGSVDIELQATLSSRIGKASK